VSQLTLAALMQRRKRDLKKQANATSATYAVCRVPQSF